MQRQAADGEVYSSNAAGLELGTATIQQLTLAQVQSFHLGGVKGIRIPTLAQFLRSLIADPCTGHYRQFDLEQHSKGCNLHAGQALALPFHVPEALRSCALAAVMQGALFVQLLPGNGAPTLCCSGSEARCDGCRSPQAP